ncbi:ribosome assembly cofactor RimP [Sungkyunkwania multivorans]|uniref:Ribosome maturation factor RimP n=1 Tax=Sungkyunkwania multivorans TaxID=1173618 RepID=A0ABW3CV06_9FLAO
MFKERVSQLLEEVLSINEDLFLIDFTIDAGNKINIILDGDKGVTLKNCMDVSRHIEHNLDREAEDFSLEVSSAGVSAPLRHVRQYVKNIGRKLSVRAAGETIEGKVIAATEDAVTLEWKAREPKPVGKGKVTVTKQQEIAYDDIEEAIVMITF